MPIPLNNEIQDTSKVIRLQLRHTNDRLVVWWYCNLYKNSRDSSQPLILVAFRKLLKNRLLSDEVVYEKVPLSALGQLTIGSIWKNGECLGQTILRSHVFDVDFTPGHWRLTSFQQAAERNEVPPYPSEIHPLFYRHDHNWLLEFKLPTGGRLIVPCLEYFTRCYGSSAELRRILATYVWADLHNQRLYIPLDEPEEPGEWKLMLGPRLVHGDARLVAHARYDRYTRRIVQNIHSQIQAHFPNHDSSDQRKSAPTKKLFFLKVGPWFQGPAKLKAEGIWFDGGKSFLALRITGGSDPDGPPIRAIKAAAEYPVSGADHEAGSSWMPARQFIQPSDTVELTGAMAPDIDAISVEIEDPPFEVLGKPRLVSHQRRTQAGTSSSSHRTPSHDASVFSGGDPYGSNKGVGYASIHARPILESHGILRDMWSALLLLKEEHPNIIQSVDWYTFEDGYRTDVEPKLIAIEPFKEWSEEMDGTTWRWPYMDSKTMQELRGVLVMRVIADGKPVHLLEIQRRPQTKKNQDGTDREGEESFQGLIFSLYNQQELDPWLALLLSEIRSVKGIFSKLIELCPGKAAPFPHKQAGSDSIPCVAATRNALRKMGIYL